jgi:hypothetical protein
MAARTRKLRCDEETRARIKTSQIVNRLTDHVLGKIQMTSSQVSAALGLLKKTLPDLAAVEHTGANGGVIQVESLSELELARRIAFALAQGARFGRSLKTDRGCPGCASS